GAARERSPAHGRLPGPRPAGRRTAIGEREGVTAGPLAGEGLLGYPRAPSHPMTPMTPMTPVTTPTPTLTLFDFPATTGLDRWESFSPFVLEVSRAMRLAKVPFATTQVNMMKLKDINPLGQLPAAAFGEEKVAGSTRILERLEALVPGSMTGGLDEGGVAAGWLWEEFAGPA